MTRFVLVIALFLSCLGGVAAADADIVCMRTSLGDVYIELDYSAPVTCANFLRYVNEGAYDYSLFHRSIPGFVVQGGGVTVDFSDYSLYDIPVYDPIVNEFSPERSNVYGTVAMARQGGAVNSATSQFFFNLADNTGLDTVDEGFTVFGNVVGGMEVLHWMESLETLNLTFLNWMLTDCPVWETYTQELVDAGYYPYLSELMWVYSAVVLADADGDGVVGAADYIALKRNFGTESGATWQQGDFDGDGDVDLDDMGTLQSSYGLGVETTVAAQSNTIPEPATLFILLGAGLPALLRHRQSRGRSPELASRLKRRRRS